MNGDEGGMLPLELGDEQEIFRNQFLRLFSVRAIFRDFEREYFVTDKGSRVGTIVWNDGQVLLVRQYRLLIDGLSWELPGGGIAIGESAVDAAIRECREEAGVLCRSVSPVFSYQQGIDVTLSPASIFETNDYKIEDEIKSNTETDMRQWVAFDQCVEMALKGELQDGMTITALLAKFVQLSRGAE